MVAELEKLARMHKMRGLAPQAEEISDLASRFREEGVPEDIDLEEPSSQVTLKGLGEKFVKAGYRVQGLLLGNFAQRLEGLIDDEITDGSGFVYRPWTGEVWVLGSVRHLSPIENSLLFYLASNYDTEVPKAEIIHNVWGVPGANDDLLRMSINRLRRKIEEDPKNPQRIVTRKDRGYMYRSTLEVKEQE